MVEKKLWVWNEQTKKKKNGEYNAYALVHVYVNLRFSDEHFFCMQRNKKHLNEDICKDVYSTITCESKTTIIQRVWDIKCVGFFWLRHICSLGEHEHFMYRGFFLDL